MSLISDSDLRVENTLYVPYFDESKELSINGNDVDLLGAIAVKKIGEKVEFFIYQGNNQWSKVSGDELKLPKPWTADPTPLGAIRWFKIDGIEYPFFSLIDNNTSQPAFSTPAAWIKTNQLGLPTYSSLATYNMGQYVVWPIIDDGTTYYNVYKSKTNGNINHNPNTDGGVNWQFVGLRRGPYASGTIYDLNDVVTDPADSDRIYISALSSNNHLLTDTGSTSTWQVIGLTKNDIPKDGKHGMFTTTDTGQATILIPHNLGAVPSYWNVRGKNANAKNLGIADESADATNIIITPVFTNNDNSTIDYLWEAKL